jgi:Domain of unknown function (DUF1707)
MARRSALRASDIDREQIAERLHHAMMEGRLLADELEERLGAAFSARTYGELDALVADLPATPSRHRARPSVPSWGRGALALVVLLAALVVAAAPPRHSMRVDAPGLGVRPQAPFIDAAHHAHTSFVPMAAAPVIAGLLAALALCAVLGWLVLQDTPSSDA